MYGVYGVCGVYVCDGVYCFFGLYYYFGGLEGWYDLWCEGDFVVGGRYFVILLMV